MPSNALIKFCPVAKEHAKGLSLIFLLFFFKSCLTAFSINPTISIYRRPIISKEDSEVGN